MSGNRGNYGTPAGGGYLHDAVQELALLEERGEADGIDLIHLNDGEEEVAEGICCDVLQQTLYDPLARLDKFKQLRKDDISIEEDMLRDEGANLLLLSLHEHHAGFAEQNGIECWQRRRTLQEIKILAEYLIGVVEERLQHGRDALRRAGGQESDARRETKEVPAGRARTRPRSSGSGSAEIVPRGEGRSACGPSWW